ncbi:hypothetical protein KPL37_04655 [Clostridium frigoris]|uniref:PIN domain-containing protein n=1 Tax=Clostridium frigoris TaxID=205327 RepID=A0ABS6BQ57_9CLOT|nr:hypothetical protein [Clostridium frigoris]MBU3159048.1 hypothetical protein [Clostridium frigoris]
MISSSRKKLSRIELVYSVNYRFIEVLKKYDRILIDTNSFIYFMEDNDAYADILQIVLEHIYSNVV